MVFPAYAGVILSDFQKVVTVLRIPRVCGGDPILLAGLSEILEYSPRMRG